MARSLASIGTFPSVRNTFRYFSWLMLYFSPSAVFPLGGTVVFSSCDFTHAKYSSTSCLIVFCRSLRRSSEDKSFKAPSSLYIWDIRLNAWQATDRLTASGFALSAIFMASA